MGRMMGAALGRQRTLVLPAGPSSFGPCLLATAVSKLTGQPWYFSGDKAREARAGSWTCSNAAAAQELGFAVGAPLAARLRQTARWYQENKWL